MVRPPFAGLALLLAAVSLAAQTVTIQGTVVDADTGVPVAGASVAVRHADAPAPLDTMVTEAPGTFELAVAEAGRYIVEASAPGYQQAVSSGSQGSIAIGEAEFEPGASVVSHRVALKVSRSGGMTGVVVGGETRKPMPLATVRAIRLEWYRGKRLATEARIVFTDDEGVFRFDSITPGDYAVMLGITSPAVAQMAAKAAEPKVYPVMVWPEGAGESGFIPLTVPPGSALDLGVIGYSKIVPPRIRAPECAGTATATVSIAEDIAGAWFNLSHDSGSICGSIAPIPPLSRGRYRLTYLSLSNGILMGEDVIRIGGEGDAPEAKVRLFPPAPVTGSITCECEAPGDGWLDALKVGIQQDFGGAGLMGAVMKAGENGALSDTALMEGDALISVSGLPPGLIVKRLIFNGAESGKAVTMHFGEPASIGVVITDKPATITGTVESGGKPAVQDHVAIAKWPLPAGVNYVDFYSAAVDDNGGFTIKGLAPGTPQMNTDEHGSATDLLSS